MAGAPATKSEANEQRTAASAWIFVGMIVGLLEGSVPPMLAALIKRHLKVSIRPANLAIIDLTRDGGTSPQDNLPPRRLSGDESGPSRL